MRFAAAGRATVLRYECGGGIAWSFLFLLLAFVAIAVPFDSWLIWRGDLGDCLGIDAVVDFFRFFPPC